MSTPDPRIAFFDRQAPTWDTEGPPPGRTLAKVEQFAPIFGLRPGDDLLEAGCGTGQLTGWLIEQSRPGRVTAVDFSPAMLTRARQRGLEADFRCVDVCSEDLGQATFDAVFCMNAFPHFRDQAAALANFARALRAGGHLIILHLDNWRAINAFHGQVGGEVAGDHLPDPFTLKEMLRQVDLQVTDLRDEEDLFHIRAIVSHEIPE